MLTAICAEIKNYFSSDEDKIFGNFSVVDGAITPSFSLADGQYYRIIGSVFNDGVHKSDDVLTDEQEFHGAIWKMRVPADLIALASEIEAWLDKNTGLDSVMMSPFTSESFGGYSYSKAKGSSASGGSSDAPISWQEMFASRLNNYRKIRAN